MARYRTKVDAGASLKSLQLMRQSLGAPTKDDVDHIMIMPGLRSVVLGAGLVTLGAWVLLCGYVGATNRWGVFAVAPALLPLQGASAGITGLGAAMWMRGVRCGRWDLPLMLVVAAHGAILLYASTTK